MLERGETPTKGSTKTRDEKIRERKRFNKFGGQIEKNYT